MTEYTPYRCNSCSQEIGLLVSAPLQCPYCFSEDTCLMGNEADVPAGDGIVMWCDGSCLDASRGDGAWAFACIEDEEVYAWADYAPDVTNNQMELEAAIQALKHIEQPSEITIVSDSKYVTDGATSWMPNWKKNGWKRKPARGYKKRENAPVKNLDYWKRLDSEINRHESVWFQWVRGHDGDEMNELCDSLASRAARARKSISVSRKIPTLEK